MDSTSRRGSRVWIVAALGALVVVVTGCGGGSSSSTGPTSTTSQSLKRLDVQVVRTQALAPAPSLLARLGDLLGWPQVAEAGHCQVSANGVSATTGPDEKATLTGVPVSAGGTIPVTISCSDGSGGNFTLTGAAPGAIVSVTVEVGPGRVEARVRDQHVSPPSQPSSARQQSAPSPPSRSGSGRS